MYILYYFSQVKLFCIRLIVRSYFRLNQINDDMYASSNVWKIYTLSHYHYITLGVVVGIAVSLVVSLLFPVDQDINPKLLSPFIRKFAYPEYMSDSKLEAKTREYELVPQETKL